MILALRRQREVIVKNFPQLFLIRAGSTFEEDGVEYEMTTDFRKIKST